MGLSSFPYSSEHFCYLKTLPLILLFRLFSFAIILHCPFSVLSTSQCSLVHVTLNLKYCCLTILLSSVPFVTIFLTYTPPVYFHNANWFHYSYSSQCSTDYQCNRSSAKRYFSCGYFTKCRMTLLMSIFFFLDEFWVIDTAIKTSCFCHYEWSPNACGFLSIIYL